MAHDSHDSTSVVFKKVRQIEPKTSCAAAAQKKTQVEIYLTCDLDWCHETVLADTLSIIEQSKSQATLFVTNQLQSLDLLRNNKNLELGIHPNFNDLLSGKQTQQNAEIIIDNLLNIVPDAKSIRSHSLVHGGGLTSLFLSKGLTHESNIKIPLSAASDILPFRNALGMIICPFQWGDYFDHGVSLKSLMPLPNYFMVNFHPIHVFLNTENLIRYEQTRHLHHDPVELIKYRHKGEGTRTRLLELLELAIP